ncbi:glyA [Wigglesworthia glossinidia endosymbiont of Glossina brevipalpis]|uniref:Serine hydroxymethyltransferase n=1 Tax=Wigglesworthia glossinidia brevipalpis TaxID=36870 RepID=GLYA_WIGBR|nr:RecName: Full=Serine hydroxymethyltransferase; Short=SHMT; Short=Serine methylase [Wigglesworthia glossinidia endosymbiont of Glossina brevipalpis]BAC24647.1 glyA [Wigglesworthia glossinidia endosymbiont of Glossina brevipalpis]
MNIYYKNFKKYDTKIYNIIKKEIIRQEEHIELIASENYASKYVMQMQGSLLTNKYAEGYPKNRYYRGCKYIDEIEDLAIKRAKKLFNVDYVNVQPHSGSQANFAVYSALLNPGDLVLGMKLNHGGHLTHGSKANFSGKMYKFISYGVNGEGKLDYNKLLNLANYYRPKMIVGGFSSYSGFINWKKMRFISDKVGAYLFADISHVAGLIVAGIYPNAIPYAHVVTTTTHKTLSGPRGGLILAKEGDDEFYKKLDSAVFPGTQGGPLMHIIAAKAVAFKEAMTLKFKKYQHQLVKNSKSMVEIFLKRKFHVVSGGTKNHLFILNLSNIGLKGDLASEILEKANITVNKNSIPNDKLNPKITSGIRIGTPAITKRGFKEIESKKVAEWICDILENINDKKLINNIKIKVINLCYKYPVYKSFK